MIKELTKKVESAFIELKNQGHIPAEKIPPTHQITVPKNQNYGDYASNIALVLGAETKKNPREIADLFVNQFNNDKTFEKVEVAGPGFINFFISKEEWQRRLKELYFTLRGEVLSNIGQGRRVLLEFVSANPTGPLHVGHGRGAAIGDTLARILNATGYNIDTEYYTNDVGNQMNTLGASVYYRYKELLGEEIIFPENHYKGDYIKDIARKIYDEVGDKYKNVQLSDCIDFFREIALVDIMDGIKKDLEDFDVSFKNWFSEKTLHESGEVTKCIKELQEKGIIYEHEGALWFRSTSYGDEKDRVVRKSDGSYTYFAADISYHVNKLKRGYDLLIDIWGADHHGYVPRVKAVIEAFGEDREKLQILLVQFVTLLEGGVQKSMSTRAGEFVTLRELIDEVGKDAARFMFLTRKNDSHLEFDLDLAKKQSQENPVYYVQYAHARICSIFKNAINEGIDCNQLENVDLSPLNTDDDISLIKKLNSFIPLVEDCAIKLEPHHISHYLLDLAGQFHNYYTKNRILTEEKDLTLARLFLASCTRECIKKGLTLLGVSAPEKM